MIVLGQHDSLCWFLLCNKTTQVLGCYSFVYLTSFSRGTQEEESVFVLPGQCFGKPNYFRIVTCPPLPKLAEAYDRIAAFCERHAT